ncbi:hypothetical protein CN918_29530 [Priestia megaterium]|nr:hypothetical protein CN918_29530 [Priestia megaterium]
MEHFKTLFSFWIIMLLCSSLLVLGYTMSHHYVFLILAVVTLLFGIANTFFYYKRTIKNA